MSLACTTCNKSESEVNLKRCAKCSTTPYCSRDCQKWDWKTHRKICGKQTNFNQPLSYEASSSASSRLSPPQGLMQPINKPFTRLSNNTWLHERPDTDVYRLLIDAYRLRVEDEYKFDGNIEEDSIYTGAQDGLNGFRRFLGLVESHRELLPSWWSPTKRELCENLGMDASQWHDLRCAVEKSDIIEHYGDQQFPMQLRMFAETVIGRGIGGADGTQMKELMVSMEGGSMDGMHSTLLDATTMKTKM